MIDGGDLNPTNVYFNWEPPVYEVRGGIGNKVLYRYTPPIPPSVFESMFNVGVITVDENYDTREIDRYIDSLSDDALEC